MVIYIYGNDSFKEDIHAVLEHSTIKIRLDENSQIKELNTLEELKEAIEDNPNNIYLIDDSKIIKKNSLNQKLKFLQAKDAIEQEYLLDNGIGDISVDSIDELTVHIKKRLDTIISERESSEIQESILGIVEDAYNEDDNNNIKNKFNTDFMIELDKKFHENDIYEDKPSIINGIEGVCNEDSNLIKDLNFDKDLDNIKNKNQIKKEEKQGESDMADEFSQFDTLDENEILAALEEMDSFNNSPVSTLKKSPSPVSKAKKENIELGASNVNDIIKLITELLNNKTLEITIKVKN